MLVLMMDKNINCQVEAIKGVTKLIQTGKKEQDRKKLNLLICGYLEKYLFLKNHFCSEDQKSADGFRAH
jgi:hypothetical protein